MSGVDGRPGRPDGPEGGEEWHPGPGSLVILGHGCEHRWSEEGGLPVLHDQFSDGLLEAARARGLEAGHLAIGRPPPLPPSLRVRIATLHGGDAGDLLETLRREWRSWRGTIRFPEHRGVSIDDPLDRLVESILPHLPAKAAEAAAMDAFCARHHPAAVVSTHLVTSFRHLIAPIRRHGALAIGIAIGCDSQEHFLRGLRDPESGCPAPDLISLWGPALSDALLARGPLGAPVVATGRARHDRFARARPAPPDPAFLRALGLPTGVERLVVFADVLRTTIGVPIVTPATARRLLATILRALEGRPGLHALYKPWRGDDLDAVRRLVAEVGDPKLHVLDPDFVPFHNVELLRHAATVISSPTSLLAEFASLGGRPIALALPETVSYLGRNVERVFAGVAEFVRAESEFEAVLERVLSDPGGASPERDLALAAGFGPPDGRSGDRLIEAIARTRENSTRP